LRFIALSSLLNLKGDDLVGDRVLLWVVLEDFKDLFTNLWGKKDE
jgi:hypothetical protein